MQTVKHLAISFAATAVAVAVIFRFAPLKKFVTGVA